MYTIEDIFIRYHRMKGDTTLWLPGADHAGFETQFVFEKYLSKMDKSRFDFTREELFSEIWNFVEKNRGTMETQLKRLGFSLDWNRLTFTLDPKIVAVVYKTFKKLHDDGLIYRGQRLVNYCTKCGTGFSDLEVKHVEQTDPLYYLKYGPFILATVRPETKFGDTAIAVNPKDKRYKDWIGKEITVDGLLGSFTLTVVGDDAIDPTFGTGVAKVTPAHDMTDFEIAKRHNLPMKLVIGYNGRLTDVAGPYAGLKVKAAREKIVEDMKIKGFIEKVDEKYTHTVATCYKCGSTLEPLPLSQWFVKVKPLASRAIEAIKKKETQFIPKRFEKHATTWLTNFHDWNISRQIVWGIRIPAWKCLDCDKKHTATMSEHFDHNTSSDAWTVTDGEAPSSCSRCQGTNLTQDTDTFDTWFSSGQWPFATLQVNQPQDYNTFYPTSIMETGYDILPWWVCRMLMLGLYATDQVPFKTVYLHGLVRDKKGQKMSKSKGNVINPLVMIDQYGADALRMALLFGTAPGNDLSLSEDKIRGMRNFANKLWNIARFYTLNEETAKTNGVSIPIYTANTHQNLANDEDKRIISELNMLTNQVTQNIERYRLSDAAQSLYEFAWHRIADQYLEINKDRLTAGEPQALSVFRHIIVTLLSLLHPFMPFVTEAVWGNLHESEAQMLISSQWPGKPTK